jgi:hypothetical protein
VRAGDADAVLEITTDSRPQGVRLGPLGARKRMARATLTLKSGEVVWSRSENFPDEPFLSGERTAGKLLVKRLARDAGCDERGQRGGS